MGYGTEEEGEDKIIVLAYQHWYQNTSGKYSIETDQYIPQDKTRHYIFYVLNQTVIGLTFNFWWLNFVLE